MCHCRCKKRGEVPTGAELGQGLEAACTGIKLFGDVSLETIKLDVRVSSEVIVEYLVW